MFRKLLIIASFAMTPALAFADGGVHTYSINTGQGPAITVTVPDAAPEPAYALTGNDVPAPLATHAVQLGQGGQTWIPQGR